MIVMSHANVIQMIISKQAAALKDPTVEVFFVFLTLSMIQLSVFSNMNYNLLPHRLNMFLPLL